MPKIRMTTPLVEMDGDEMTRVLWAMIKDTLIQPYVELSTEYYDLGLLHRNDTDDQVTVDAANAAKKHGVAVKCATVTPNKQDMEAYPQLKKLWKSPNATIRSILDGTVFRAPIIINGVKPAVRSWTQPITIARHAYGDIYSAVEHRADKPGSASMTVGGTEIPLQTLNSPAVWMAMHNTDDSIRSFARSCFKYAIATKQDLWFSTKDTIAKIYDGRFREIFDVEYQNYKADFDSAGITYFYTLIDDAASRVMRSPGGFIWALKNYDGDVMSDLISSAFGSLAMMTSVLVSPDGNFEYEAAHGTVRRHYHGYLKGETPRTNPVASIFAWTGAIQQRGEKDSLPELADFGARLEKACVDTMNRGIMTRDLVNIAEPGAAVTPVDTRGFFDAVKVTLETV